MGVMACSRSGCPSIMCDMYVPEIGYICIECEREFKQFLKKKGLNPTTKGEILTALKVFMETEKGSFNDDEPMTVDEFFKKQIINE